MYRSYNDFSGGNLVDNVWIKGLEVLGLVNFMWSEQLALILLGAVTTDNTSAFRLIPLGLSGPAISISIGSTIWIRLTQLLYNIRCTRDAIEGIGIVRPTV